MASKKDSARSSAAQLLATSCIAGAGLLAAGAPALAECKTEIMTAKGTQSRDIEGATQSAQDSLLVKVKAALGKEWTLGSRRGAIYKCERPMGGQAKYISWTCTLESYPCRP